MTRTAMLVCLVALLLVLLPGGRGLGFQAEAGPAEPGRIAYIGTDGNVWTMLPDGSDKTRLTTAGNARGPRWSQDWKRVAYVTASQTGEISTTEVRVVDNDGRNDRAAYRLVEQPWSGFPRAAKVDWLPDGRLLVELAVTKSGSGPECLVSAEGTEEHVLPGGGFCLDDATMSGGRFRISQSGVIAHEMYEPTPEPLDPAYWVYCVGIGVRSSIQAAEERVTDACGNPSPSPDGATVAYAYGGDIGVADTDGEDEDILYADVPHDPQFPYATWVDWSPSGSQIVFSGLDGIYLVPVDGSAPPIKLADGSDPDWQPAPPPCPTTCSQAPNGLNTCDLQAGDILLSQQVGGLYAAENLLFNGYWTHAGIYNGCGMITESSGHCDSWWQLWTCSDEPGVEVKPIEDSGFWSAPDWAILRTKSDGGKRDAAVAYAKAQDPKKYNWLYPDKWTEDKFYCSQLVWCAYQKQGVDLDSNRGAINALTKWVGPWGVADAAGVMAAVPPDDIYFDDDVTLVKQRPGIGAALRRAVLRILSPAHLYVTDPEGRHTGIDPATGQVVEEIPGVFYSGPDVEPEFLSIQDMAGTWDVQTIGTDEGSYTLQLESVDAENHRLTEVDGEAKEGQVTTYEATHLGAGWNSRCYAGEPKPVEEALAEIIDSVVAVYRLNPDQTFARWFPGRPDLSTISELNPYDQLFILTSGSAGWVQQLASTRQMEVDLVQGWNSICYTGGSAPASNALSPLSGDVAVLYRLGEDQAWARYVPDRPDMSNITQMNQLDAVLVLVTQPGGAHWTFEPQAATVASSVFVGPGVSLQQLDPKFDGLTVTVDGSVQSSAFDIARIVWDWGDGTVEEGGFPARHAYAQPGRYTLTVRVYDAGGAEIAGQSSPIEVGS